MRRTAYARPKKGRLAVIGPEQRSSRGLDLQQGNVHAGSMGQTKDRSLGYVPRLEHFLALLLCLVLGRQFESAPELLMVLPLCFS